MRAPRLYRDKIFKMIPHMPLNRALNPKMGSQFRIDLVPGTPDLPFKIAAQRCEIFVQLFAMPAPGCRAAHAFIGWQVLQIPAAAFTEAVRPNAGASRVRSLERIYGAFEPSTEFV